MVGDPNTGGARILAPPGNARLWYLGTESRMGAAPIAESGSRYYSGAFPEGATILAPPVLESPTILQIVAAAGHRGMHACRGQFRIDQSSQSEMSRLKFITD